jgi:hypothetical protein
MNAIGLCLFSRILSSFASIKMLEKGKCKSTGLVSVLIYPCREETLETIALLIGTQPFQQSLRSPRRLVACQGGSRLKLARGSLEKSGALPVLARSIADLLRGVSEGKTNGPSEKWRGDRRDATRWTRFWLAVSAIVVNLLFRPHSVSYGASCKPMLLIVLLAVLPLLQCQQGSRQESIGGSPLGHRPRRRGSRKG